MAKVLVFGNGQLASVAYFYLTHDSPHEVVAFPADRDYMNAPTLFDLPVVPFEDVQTRYSPDIYKMFVMVSYQRVNTLRAEKYHQAKEKGYSLINYVSSKATVWPDLSPGENSFIMEHNVIQPFVTIGDNVIMWSGNHISHHTIIKEHCFLALHVVVSGNVTIEPYCFLGVNATIRDNITVAPKCVIGTGAQILKDTEEEGIYAERSTKKSPLKSSQLPKI